MKKILLLSLCLGVYSAISAQSKYMTRNGMVKFEAEGPVKDDVKATNNQAACILNAETGEVVFQIAIKSFIFKKALMQEHFNENYMESHKFPKAVLKGKILDFEKLDLSKDGTYEVEVSGILEMHGVKNQVTEKGQLTITDGSIELHASFWVTLADYNIEIPKLVENKLAKQAEVILKMALAPVS